MAIVKRVQLGSSVRRVTIKQPKGVPPALAFEHIYRELILVAPGGPDQGLPDSPGLPTVGIPGFPDQGLPDAPAFPDNNLPPLPIGWPGCPGVDNSLPEPPAHVDNTLPDGGIVDNTLPTPPPTVGVPPMPWQLPGVPVTPPPTVSPPNMPGQLPEGPPSPTPKS